MSPELPLAGLLRACAYCGTYLVSANEFFVFGVPVKASKIKLELARLLVTTSAYW
jgi:hypothetical protein